MRRPCWSTRPAGKRNRTPQDWIKGLIGVSAEASHSGWKRNLTPQEARTAAAYATIELNGFAPYIVDLAAAHPSEVEGILGGEVSAELVVGSEYEHLPTLQNLSHADTKLKRLLVQVLETRVLGLTVRALCSGSETSILVGEVVLGALEVFLATAPDLQVIPHTEVFEIEIKEEAKLDEPSFQVDLEQMRGQFFWPANKSPAAFDYQKATVRSLMKVS